MNRSCSTVLTLNPKPQAGVGHGARPAADRPFASLWRLSTRWITKVSLVPKFGVLRDQMWILNPDLTQGSGMTRDQRLTGLSPGTAGWHLVNSQPHMGVGFNPPTERVLTLKI